jgi:hypothetical protein
MRIVMARWVHLPLAAVDISEGRDRNGVGLWGVVCRTLNFAASVIRLGNRHQPKFVPCRLDNVPSSLFHFFMQCLENLIESVVIGRSA